MGLTNIDMEHLPNNDQHVHHEGSDAQLSDQPIQQQVINIDEGEEDKDNHKKEEDKQNQFAIDVDQRECKICTESKGLLESPVCSCRGTAQAICKACLRKSICISQITQCPDCRSEYEGIDYIMVPNETSFWNFLQLNQNQLYVVFVGPGVGIVLLSMINIFTSYGFHHILVYIFIGFLLFIYLILGCTLCIFYSVYINLPRVKIGDIRIKKRKPNKSSKMDLSPGLNRRSHQNIQVKGFGRKPIQMEKK